MELGVCMNNVVRSSVTPADIQIRQFSVTLRVCVTLSRFVSVREDLSHVHINNTHVASASSLPLTDLEFGYSSFLLLLPMCRVIITDTVISGSIVCFPVGSLIQCRRANDDFLNFFFFFFGIAPLESHADIYRRQLMFRLLFFIFFNLYCPDLVSLKKLIEMSLKKKMILKNVFLFHWNAAPLLSLAVLWLTTLSTPKNQSARQISTISKWVLKWCVFFHSNDLSGLSLIYLPILNLCQLHKVCKSRNY